MRRYGRWVLSLCWERLGAWVRLASESVLASMTDSQDEEVNDATIWSMGVIFVLGTPGRLG